MDMQPGFTTPTLTGRERLWLIGAQAFSALVSASGLTYVLGRHPWFKVHAPVLASRAGLLTVGLAFLVFALARLWQVWEEARLRRLITVSEGALGRQTWKRALGMMLGIQYLGGGLALGAVALGVPGELLFTGILFLLVAPVATSSWIGRCAERMLVRQRDLALQARMAPHFLYNSLSTLKGQIAQDPGEAEVTADRLAQLFRDLMDHTAGSSVPLGQELTWVEAYLGLERARLGGRLEVVVEVADGLEEVPVPPLCLQVLVENAIKHGISPRGEGGRLGIRVDREGAGLRLSVTDPGDGCSREGGTGQALSMLRQRLRRPTDLSLERIPGGGHRASLWVQA